MGSRDVSRFFFMGHTARCTDLVDLDVMSDWQATMSTMSAMEGLDVR
jgi:hypothetical protein